MNSINNAAEKHCICKEINIYYYIYSVTGLIDQYYFILLVFSVADILRDFKRFLFFLSQNAKCGQWNLIFVSRESEELIKILF